MAEPLAIKLPPRPVPAPLAPMLSLSVLEIGDLIMSLEVRAGVLERGQTAEGLATVPSLRALADKLHAHRMERLDFIVKEAL